MAVCVRTHTCANPPIAPPQGLAFILLNLNCAPLWQSLSTLTIRGVSPSCQNECMCRQRVYVYVCMCACLLGVMESGRFRHETWGRTQSDGSGCIQHSLSRCRQGNGPSHVVQLRAVLLPWPPAYKVYVIQDRTALQVYIARAPLLKACTLSQKQEVWYSNTPSVSQPAAIPEITHRQPLVNYHHRWLTPPRSVKHQTRSSQHQQT